MRVSTSAAAAAVALLATRALSKSIDITHEDQSVSFFAPVSDGSSEPAWIFPGTDVAQGIESACEGGSSVVTHVAGAGFEFQFSGTALSLVTSPNSAYSVSIDGAEPILVNAPAMKRGLASRPASHLDSRALACGVTFASEQLARGSHTVRIVASERSAAADGLGLAFVRATVNDGDLPQPTAHAQTAPAYSQADQMTLKERKPESHTATIAICAIVGTFVVLVPLIIFVICRRRRYATPTQTRELDLESKPASILYEEPPMRQVPGRDNTPSWVVHSITKKFKLDDRTGEPVQVGATGEASKPRGPFRGRRVSARSSWTSFAAGSPRDAGTPVIAGGIGAGAPRHANDAHTSTVGSLNDTLTLLRPPVPPKNKQKKEKKASHPFRKASIHPTRPKVGRPVLRIQT